MDKSRSKIDYILEASFLLLVFSLGFMRPNLEIHGLNLPLTDLLFLVTGSVWLTAIILNKASIRIDRVYWPVGLYTLTLFISAVLSENPGFSLLKFLGELYLIGLAVLTINIVSTPAFFRKTILAWLTASSISAGIGTVTVICFYFGISMLPGEFSLDHFGSLPPGNYVRIQSTFLYPAMLCNYLTIGMLMSFAARRRGWIRQYLFVGMLAIFTVAIAFTLTPGIGGIFLAVALWFWVAAKEVEKGTGRKLVLVSGISVSACFLIVSAFRWFQITTSPYFFSIGGVRIDPSGRLLAWQSAFQTFLQNPFFGYGLGLPVANVLYALPSGQMSLVTDAHNVFLSVAGESGIFAVIALVFISVAAVQRSALIKNTRIEIDLLRSCLGIAFVSAFLYQGLVGSFEDSRHIWVLIGLIIAADRISDDRPTQTRLGS